MLSGLIFVVVVVVHGVTTQSSLPWGDVHSTHHRVAGEEAFEVAR